MKSGAVASEPAADEAANRVLEEGASAADAIIAGFLAASARRPGALFSPLQALFAGPGAGARAFDGRTRQPGKGLARPRGIVKPQDVPDVARVAVPASLAALALLHAYGGQLTLDRLAHAAVETNALDERTQVIVKFAERGPAALADAAIARPLLAAAGRTEGGLLSEADLADVRPESQTPKVVEMGAGRRAMVAPWPAPEEPQRSTEFVIAADVTGVMAALSYAPDDDGLAVPELGLTLSRDAVAVRRGIPRVPPGEPLPHAAPIAMGFEHHVLFLALGVRSKTPLDVARMAATWSDPAVTGAMLLGAANEAARGTYARGVLRSAQTEQVQKLSL